MVGFCQPGANPRCKRGFVVKELGRPGVDTPHGFISIL